MGSSSQVTGRPMAFQIQAPSCAAPPASCHNQMSVEGVKNGDRMYHCRTETWPSHVSSHSHCTAFIRKTCILLFKKFLLFLTFSGKKSTVFLCFSGLIFCHFYSIPLCFK